MAPLTPRRIEERNPSMRGRASLPNSVARRAADRPSSLNQAPPRQQRSEIHPTVIDLTGEDSDAEPEDRRPQRAEGAATLTLQPRRRHNPTFDQPADGPHRDIPRKRKRTLSMETQVSPAPPSPPDATCTVCDEVVRARDLVQLLGCDHAPKVCKICFTGWVRAQLDTTVSDSIECPAYGCPYVIVYQDVQQHANTEVLEKYDFHLFKEKLY
ncbi:hypothetical protein HBI88_100820 [Parastagonospora nodorum]|nr:hypothetical protein HBH61_138390 [Parastagonospora nodorum]KAH5074608.1 hypothetical protein HBH95_144300 [Parastagonospora nodorum]KAH5788529.1 hypothetical protein HBI97_074780 [Parastagonospora nodorum]KAH5814356.1 hypothetical protein HBI96_072060 [Parastagonospora nodorum]KAH5828491.1 hypothetical protein HBI94_056480 [Parastagonospora nodorum]